MKHVFNNHKFIRIILGLVVILILGSYLNLKKSNASTNTDYFTYIVSLYDADVCEYGVTAEFKNSGDGEETCYKLFKLFGLNKDSNVTVYKDNCIYRIEFENPLINGYIECNNELYNENYIIINEVSKDKDRDISYLKYQFQQNLKGQKSKIKYYEYLKAKINTEKEVDIINNEIVTILKNSGAINIDTVDIGNGYSSTAYTGQYETIKNEHKLNDLNIAVTKYDTGKYIIMGTPLIKETY